MERKAAARALVEWTDKDYELRIGEWGVWLADNSSQFQLVDSVIAEIPDFATRTQNLVDDLQRKRMNRIMIVDKPVVHFTANQLMTVDLTVYIDLGQIWFAYPPPSDFHLQISSYAKSKEEKLSSLRLKPFTKLVKQRSKKFPTEFSEGRTGYDWMSPAVPTFGSTGGRLDSANSVRGVGLTWENLILSPTMQKSWMKLPVVPAKQRWWSNLRKVKSDWVSVAGGKTEKFLYYDGPTVARSPFKVETDDQRLGIIRRSNRKAFGFIDPSQAMLIHVKNGKAISASWSFWKKELEIDATKIKWVGSEETIDKFYQLVTSNAGLTPNEADGMYESWKKQFFETDGIRLLLRINQTEYDVLCPLSLRPLPTEISRVGLILHELDQKKLTIPFREVKEAYKRRFDNGDFRKKVDAEIRTRSKARALLNQILLSRNLRTSSTLDKIVNASDPFRKSIAEEIVRSRHTNLRFSMFTKYYPSGASENALIGADKDFKRRNMFLRAFVEMDFPEIANVDAYKHIDYLLKQSMTFIKSGAKIPDGFGEKVALFVVKTPHQTNLNHETELHKLVREICLTKCKSQPLDSELNRIMKKRVVVALEKLQKFNETDLVLISKMLHPDTVSELFELAIKTTSKLNEKRGNEGRYDISKTLDIAKHLAMNVPADKVDQFKKITLKMQADSKVVRFALPFQQILRNLNSAKRSGSK